MQTSQDPPSMLLEMKALLDQNTDLDCVGTRRTSREGEPFFRSFCANLFYRLMQKISPVALPSGVRDFSHDEKVCGGCYFSLNRVQSFFQRVSLLGLVSERTILTIQMSKGRPARPVGVLGNFFSTPLKGLLIFQIFP